MELLKSLLFLAFICNGPSGGFAQTEFRTSSFPYPYYFHTGGEVIVTCWIPNGFTFQHWVHPNNEFISSTNGRYLVNTVPGSVTLKVTNAVESDGGSYTCHATAGAAPMSSSISVYHTVPLTIYSTSVNATINVGESYSFSCNATNFILLQWVYSKPSQRDYVLSNTTDGRITITPDYELQLRDIQFEDEGMYKCLVTNNLGRLSLKNNLSVIAHPEVFVEGSFKEVTENSSTVLTCTVTGVPRPTVSWRDRAGQTIQSAGGVSVASEVVNSSAVVSRLMFSMVGSAQTGPYTCWAINKYNSSYATINLRLHDTPEPPRDLTLTLFNYTNIRVNWTAPQSSVDTYVIMYQALNGSSSGVHMSKTVPSSAGTSAVLTGLSRLTLYSVLVYAKNSHGASPNSNKETIATTATVPGVPSDVVVLDIGPTSLRVEWPSSSLPLDDGGAQLLSVRITALVVQDGRLSPTVNKTVSVEDGYTTLEGLKDTTSYQVRVEFSNGIGYGPGLLSSTFQTPLPGAPGSPIHVFAKILESTSVLLCWQDSASGQPFLQYKFEVQQSGEDIHQTFRRKADEVESHPEILGCDKSVKVPGVKSESCYRYKVIVINRVGNGQPSAPSDEICTPKSLCDGAECVQENCVDGKNCTIKSTSLSTMQIIIVVVVPVVIASVVLALVVTTICCCTARRVKMRDLEKRGEYIPDIDRRGSANSGTKLLSTGRNFSGSFSSCSLTNSPDQLEQPGTATTLLSNVFEEDFTKSNEAQFFPESSPKSVSVPHGTIPPVQPIIYTSDGRQRVLQLPQGKHGGEHGTFTANGTMYTIAEDPPSYSHCMNPAPGPPNAHGRIVMTDNPNYDDRQMMPVMSRGQSTNELEHSGSSTPPPIPPYYGGSMTDVQSEPIANRFVHVPTPFFGESYSQAGYSPDQDRRADPKQSQSTVPYSSSKEFCPQEDASNNVNLVDNDAYETFTSVRGPKFEIKGGEERGSIRETVQIRKH